MRSYNPDEPGDVQEAALNLLRPEHLALLAMNPDYVYWGPHEDYMCERDSGWRAPVSVATWAESPFGLDDLNEVVHFYFEVERPTAKCPDCKNGYSPFAQGLFDTFYKGWGDHLTPEDLAVLVENGRGQKSSPLGHDSLDQHLMVGGRCARAGQPSECATCTGRSYVFTDTEPVVSLVLWVLHPRKGASRGVKVERVTEADLPAVFDYLRQAATRNAARFMKIPAAGK